MPRKLKILVAEDDPDDFFFLNQVLKKSAVAFIFHVGDGGAAIDFLSGKSPYLDRSSVPTPDVVLLDLKLPRVSGHEVLQWLKRQKRLSKMKVYVLSGAAEELERARALNIVADGYFLKPLSLGHLAVIFGKNSRSEPRRPKPAPRVSHARRP